MTKQFLGDMTRIAEGVMSMVLSMREELEAKLREYLEKLLEQMNLVRREEFEAVKEMAVHARLVQEEQLKRLTILEARLEEIQKGRVSDQEDNHD